MTVWTFLLVLYVASTIAAVVMTYREQRRTTLVSPLYRLIGYLACTVWPLVAVVFVVTSPADARH
jgi:cytochrome c oxidase assembly factor CtaG